MRIQGSGLRVQGSGFRVQALGCRVEVAGCRVQGAGFGDLEDKARACGDHLVDGQPPHFRQIPCTREQVCERVSARVCVSERERNREGVCV